MDTPDSPGLLLLKELGPPPLERPADHELLRCGFETAYVTELGTELFNQDPLLIADFKQAARSILSYDDPGYWQELRLGYGPYGSVYELPGFPKLCIKTVTNRFHGNPLDDFETVRPINLLTDIKVMNAVHRQLIKNPLHNVHTPQHYAAVSLKNRRAESYAMLMERLPDGLMQIDEYIQSQGFDEEEESAVAQLLRTRLNEAIGFSVVRLFINDFTTQMPGKGTVKLRGDNTLIQPDKPLQDTPMHVVDLARPGGVLQSVARAALLR